MTDIPRNHLDLYEDRLLMFSQVPLSYANARQLMHQARQFLTMRTTLEQIASGGRSNVDFSQWAKRILDEEKAGRPKVKRRSSPLVKLEVAS